uniref:C-type lectin domain-containing protein n=2 Tax=Graphocephala atropunctata TaxID=36148 RepID=A0A1B6KYY9_9HEMI
MWVQHALCICVLVSVGCVFGEDGDLISLPQCITNEECDQLLTCIDLKCQDPCPGVCRGNANCEIHNHVPYCGCKPGFSGNPFTGCQQETPKGPPSGNPRGRKVYRVERFVKINWYAALIHCQGHGGRLASIESQQENEMAKAEIAKTNIRNDRFWTSGTDYPLGGPWVWMSSGNSPTFFDWLPGEPNNNVGSEHCLNLYEVEDKGYMWNDVDCLEEMFPICEYFE